MAAELFEMRERGIYKEVLRREAQVVLYGVDNNAVPNVPCPNITIQV